MFLIKSVSNPIGWAFPILLEPLSLEKHAHVSACGALPKDTPAFALRKYSRSLI